MKKDSNRMYNPKTYDELLCLLDQNPGLSFYLCRLVGEVRSGWNADENSSSAAEDIWRAAPNVPIGNHLLVGCETGHKSVSCGPNCHRQRIVEGVMLTFHFRPDGSQFSICISVSELIRLHHERPPLILNIPLGPGVRVPVRAIAAAHPNVHSRRAKFATA